MAQHMSEATIEIHKKYQNKWVALNKSEDKVIAWGKNIKVVLDKLEKEKKKAFVIEYILPLNSLHA
ncbi:MAG: DUF5678 domain-containing protein [Patescibacteria group bacterium]